MDGRGGRRQVRFFFLELRLVGWSLVDQTAESIISTNTVINRMYEVRYLE